MFSENHLPKSQIASSAPYDFLEHHFPKSQIASSITRRCFRETSPQISNRKQCPPKIPSGMETLRMKPMQTAHECQSSENHLPTSQIASSVPRRFLQRIISPNLKSQAVSPEDFFRESSPQISYRKQYNQKMFQRIISPNLKSLAAPPPPYDFSRNSPNLKSQAVSPEDVSEKTSPQISNHKQCPQTSFQRIISPNLTTQAESA